MKIIETNVSKDEECITRDIQSRIINVSDWDSYCDLYRNYNGKSFGMNFIVDTNLLGCSMPNNATILDIDIDEQRIIVRMTLFNDTYMEKYAYRIE